MKKTTENTVLHDKTPPKKSFAARMSGLFGVAQNTKGQVEAPPQAGGKVSIETKEYADPKGGDREIRHVRDERGNIIRTEVRRNESSEVTRNSDIHLDLVGGSQTKRTEQDNTTTTRQFVDSRTINVKINADAHSEIDRAIMLGRDVVQTIDRITAPIAGGLGAAIGEVPLTIRLALSIIDKAITPFASFNLENLIRLNDQIAENPLRLAFGWFMWLGGIAAGIWAIACVFKETF